MVGYKKVTVVKVKQFRMREGRHLNFRLEMFEPRAPKPKDLPFSVRLTTNGEPITNESRETLYRAGTPNERGSKTCTACAKGIAFSRREISTTSV